MDLRSYKLPKFLEPRPQEPGKSIRFPQHAAQPKFCSRTEGAHSTGCSWFFSLGSYTERGSTFFCLSAPASVWSHLHRCHEIIWCIWHSLRQERKIKGCIDWADALCRALLQHWGLKQEVLEEKVVEP